MVRIEQKKIDNFVKDLKKLFKKHGMYIDCHEDHFSTLCDGETGFVIGNLHGDCDFEEKEGNDYV